MSFGIAQIMSYYPKYSYLDKVLEVSGKNKLCLHVDLRNALRSLYLQPCVEHIVNETKLSRHIDVSIFLSFLEFVSFHKAYARKRGIDIQLYFFYEKGTSSYHEMYNKQYKSKRHITNLFNLGEAYTEIFYKVVSKNLDLILKVGDRLPGCFVLYLDFLEADFIPYYLINRLKIDNDDSAHIIYSNDKDHNQTLIQDNVFQFLKRHKGGDKIINKKSVWENFLTKDIPHDMSYIPLFHAIIGDAGDEVVGVKNIAQGKLINHCDEIVAMTGTMEHMYQNLKKNNKIFDPSYLTNTPAVLTIKHHESQIINSLYQVSYYLISNFFDDDSNTEIIKKKKRILSSIDPLKPKIKNGNTIYEAFENSGISLSINEQTIFNLF